MWGQPPRLSSRAQRGSSAHHFAVEQAFYVGDGIWTGLQH
jgi:hypothetical protein